LPGSGKSTWVRQAGGTALSSDDLRQLLIDDATDQTIHRRVFATLRYLIRQRVELRRAVTYIDATNLTRKDRRPYIKMAEICGCQVEAVFFNVPIAVCQQRNRLRNRIVPEAAIEHMAMRMVAPSLEEGFSRVTVIQDPDPPR
jgi:predicted kinase